MTQNLNGVDIYHCPFFEVDSSGRLKFAMGTFYDRTPESFKTISEIKDVIRYCMWVIEKKDAMDISRYAAIVYINKVSERFSKIEKEYVKILRKQQMKDEQKLNESVDKPGRTYL